MYRHSRRIFIEIRRHLSEHPNPGEQSDIPRSLFRLLKQGTYAIIDIKYIIWRFGNGLTGLDQGG
jgi:hypothetical protein